MGMRLQTQPSSYHAHDMMMGMNSCYDIMMGMSLEVWYDEYHWKHDKSDKIRFLFNINNNYYVLLLHE